MAEPEKKASSWPRTPQVAGALLAVLAAPLLPINPILWLVVTIPGLFLFVVGRIEA